MTLKRHAWTRRILVGMLGALVLLLVPVVGGLFVPTGHVASGSAAYAQTPEQLWAAISDFESWPDWNSAVTQMVRKPDRDGHAVWVAIGESGEMPSVVEVSEPPRLLVTRIPEDAGIGFHGSWTYEIDQTTGGARLKITERGEVGNPVFRFVSLFLDQRATMNRFLEDLGARFGEAVDPEPSS